MRIGQKNMEREQGGREERERERETERQRDRELNTAIIIATITIEGYV